MDNKIVSECFPLSTLFTTIEVTGYPSLKGPGGLSGLVF